METLITFKTAKLAKDKEFGYDFTGTHYVPGFYSEDGENFEEFEMQQENAYRLDYYIRPSQSVLQKWLREEHNIDILINKTISGIYYYIIWKGSTKLKPIGRFYKYEDCFEDGLFEALNLI